MKSAIILDGQLKSALSAVRSLGRAGVTVSVGAERTLAMARHSRYATRKFLYASPYRYPDLFLEHLKNAVAKMGDKPVVFAFSDATALLLARHREDLSRVATLVLASDESTKTVFDKARTYELADRRGVPTITTYAPPSLEALKEWSRDLSYPVVIKPRHSVSWKEGKGVFGTASFVYTADELEAKFASLHASTGEPPLIQLFIRGDEYGVECLCRGGKIHAVVVHKRLRSLSPTGGASVLKETVGENSLTNQMRAHAENLLRVLQWTGVAMVEFKVDATDGQPKLMEINGRFWGSLPLSVFAGVDFPYLYYQLAGGVAPKKVVRARPGVVSEHVLGSVRWLTRVMWARDPLRKTLFPSRLSALRSFIMPSPGVYNDVWSFADPLPGLIEHVDALLGSVLKR